MTELNIVRLYNDKVKLIMDKEFEQDFLLKMRSDESVIGLDYFSNLLLHDIYRPEVLVKK